MRLRENLAPSGEAAKLQVLYDGEVLAQCILIITTPLNELRTRVSKLLEELLE